MSKKLEDQIDTIKEKEPNALLFWMREKWVKDHNNLIYEYQDNQEKIKKIEIQILLNTEKRQ